MEKGKKEYPATAACAAAADARLSFQCNKWGKVEKGIACNTAGLFSRYSKRTMTLEGQKRNVPHLLQTQQALVCRWSISETLLLLHCCFTSTVNI